ncbi:magnesium transporter, partial [Staphylococcus haemolyticus]
VSVRNISTGEIDEKIKFKVSLRDAGSCFLSGLVCATFLFIIIVVIYRQPFLALIFGGSRSFAMWGGGGVGCVCGGGVVCV